MVVPFVLPRIGMPTSCVEYRYRAATGQSQVFGTNNLKAAKFLVSHSRFFSDCKGERNPPQRTASCELRCLGHISTSRYVIDCFRCIEAIDPQSSNGSSGSDPGVAKRSKPPFGVIGHRMAGKEAIPAVRAMCRQRPLWPTIRRRAPLSQCPLRSKHRTLIVVALRALIAAKFRRQLLPPNLRGLTPPLKPGRIRSDQDAFLPPLAEVSA
jgi:hypothetical protein